DVDMAAACYKLTAVTKCVAFLTASSAEIRSAVAMSDTGATLEPQSAVEARGDRMSGTSPPPGQISRLRQQPHEPGRMQTPREQPGEAHRDAADRGYQRDPVEPLLVGQRGNREQ